MTESSARPLVAAGPHVVRRRRRGFLLPFVLVALLVVAALAGAMGLGAWRAMRAARLAWNGERAAQAADEGLAVAAADWDAESFAGTAVGTRWARTVTTADAAAVDVALARVGPLTAVAEATARSKVSGSPDTATRRAARVLSLEAPRFPLLGALTVLSRVHVTGTADVDGRDLLSGSDGCAPERDSASVAGVFAGDVSVVGADAAVQGSVMVLAPGLSSPEMQAQRIRFDSAWTETVARVQRRDALAPSRALPIAPAWSARYVSAADSSRRVVLNGAWSHEGLLLVDGDLVVHGRLVLRGLLAVGGALDVTGGILDVEGGIIVRDIDANGSHVASGARVRYSPCTVLRALAGVARPAIAPYGLWIAR